MTAQLAVVLDRGLLRVLGKRTSVPIYEVDGLVLAATGYVGDYAGLPAADSDTSQDRMCRILARAYRDLGTKMAANLDGQFATVIACKLSGKAVAAHDAMGVMPLFWRIENESLILSNDLSALIKPDDRDLLDDEYSADFLINSAPTNSRTPYRKIHRLVVGQALEWCNGQATVRTAWQPPVPIDAAADARHERVDQFRDLVQDACRRAMTGAKRPVVSLSGGLDSALVAALAKRCRPDLVAFSVLARDSLESDETEAIIRCTDYLGMDTCQIDIGESLPFSLSPPSFHSEPTEAVVSRALERSRAEALMCSRHDVLLTGVGGNRFMGQCDFDQPVELADALWRLDLRLIIHQLLRWTKEGRIHRPFSYWLFSVSLSATWRHLRGHRAIWLPAHLRLPEWIDRDYAARFNLKNRAKRKIGRWQRAPGAQLLIDELQSMTTQMEPTVGTGLNIRHPLLEREVQEFLWKLPLNDKMTPRADRIIERRALKGLVPEAHRLKLAGGTGSQVFSKGIARSKEWREFLCEDVRMARLGMADLERWRNTVISASLGHGGTDRQLMAGIAMETWLKGLDKMGTETVETS